MCDVSFQVLQCSVDRELNLYSDVKEQTNPVARLGLFGLTSQPVDQEINGHRKQASSDAGECKCACLTDCPSVSLFVYMSLRDLLLSACLYLSFSDLSPAIYPTVLYLTGFDIRC